MPSIAAGIGNQYKTWVELAAALGNPALAGARKVIVLNEDATVPAGTYDLDYSPIIGIASRTILALSDGVVLQKFAGVAGGAAIRHDGNSPVVTDFPSWPSTGPGSRIHLRDQSGIQCTETAPFARIDEGLGVEVTIAESAFITGEDGQEVFEINSAGAGDGTLEFKMLDAGWINDDTIKGPATANVSADVYSVGAVVSETQPDLAATFAITRHGSIDGMTGRAAEPQPSDIQLIWRPLEASPGPNAFADFGTLMAFRAQVDAPVTIVIDQRLGVATFPTAGMPGAGWDLLDTHLAGPPNVFGSAVVPEGVKFQNFRSIASTLELNFTGTTPPVSDLTSYASFSCIDGHIKCSGSGVFFDVPAGETFIYTSTRATLTNAGYEVINLANGSGLIFASFERPLSLLGNTLGSNTIRGTGTPSASADLYAADPTVSTTHTNLPVSLTLSRKTDAEREAYDHTSDTHTGSSGNTQGAIKGLDAAVEIGADSMHLVTAGEVTQGWITLPSTPVRAGSVKIWKVSGVMQVNKQIVGATGATPDFDVGVDGGADRVSINNNGSATGLSGTIVSTDILIISYEV
jgi:hypothetical protein